MDPAGLSQTAMLNLMPGQTRLREGAATETASANDDAAKLRQAAEGFEALFLNTMLKTARQTKLGEDILGGKGVESMQAMLDTELAQMSAARSRLGIADAIERQFSGFVRNDGSE